MEFYYHDLDHNVLVLSADGGLNAETSDEFVEKLGALIDAGIRKIIVDCTRLVYVSSAGLGTLVRIHKRMAERGGDVKIAGLTGAAAQVMALTRLDRLFDIYPDVNRARLAFRSPEGA